MDLEIVRLSEKIISVLNESQIPIEVKRYVLKDIYLMVEAKAKEIIMQEKIIMQEEIREKKKQEEAQMESKGEA